VVYQKQIFLAPSNSRSPPPVCPVIRPQYIHSTIRPTVDLPRLTSSFVPTMLGLFCRAFPPIIRIRSTSLSLVLLWPHIISNTHSHLLAQLNRTWLPSHHLSNPTLSTRISPYRRVSSASVQASKGAPTYATALRAVKALSPNYITGQHIDISSPRSTTHQHSMKYLKYSDHFKPLSASSFNVGIGCRTI
jgi:hypothetical protein